MTLALAAGACATVAWYTLVRAGQHLAYGETNPAEVVYSEHAAYFWRAWTASYLGAMTSFTVWLFAGRAEARVARALSTAIVAAAALLVLQAIFIP